MQVTLHFTDEEEHEARTALRAGEYYSCLFDLANLMRRATHDEPWDAQKVYAEFWRICDEDYGIDPLGDEP